MPVVVADNSKLPEHIQYRRPRINPPFSERDPIPNPPQIPSVIQSSRSKPTISSLLLSSLSPNNETTITPKKKNFRSSTFRGLGCAASSHVSVPAAIRTAADWEEKNKVGKKKQQKKMKNKAVPISSRITSNPSLPSSSVVVPDVFCGPGIGLTTDAASVDCVVVSRRGVSSGRVKIDGDKINQREREREKERERERPSCATRRMVNPEPVSFMDSDHSMGGIHSGFDLLGGARYHRHVRHPSPEGFAEIMMLQSNLMMGGRSDRFDRYREWRLDVDNMSYEELLELGDRIGYVNTGLKEDEIVHCLRKTKLLGNWFSRFPTEMEGKCSICQEDYEEEDEIGKLECGHFYHIDCVKQWLERRNACPICKTAAASQ